MSEESKLGNIERLNNSASIWNSRSKPNLRLTKSDLDEMREAVSEPFTPYLNSLSDIWEGLRTDILDRDLTPKHPIGLRTLDEILWGLHKKELTVIGARTSQGKSAFSMFLVKKMVEQMQRVIEFSLEMSKESLLERLFASVVKIDNRQLRRGTAKDRVLDEESFFKSWMDKAKLLIDDQYGYDFKKVIRIVEIIKPDFVFIDYIQMISTQGFKSKLEAIEEYVRKFKQLAIDMNFGAIILSQINRSGVESQDMSKFKWAGVLEEHSDNCITLKWDWSMEHPNDFIVNIEKQRHGEVRNGIKIKFIPEFYTFEDFDKPKESFLI